MHLYFIPRGIRHQIENFEKFIQCQMWPWKRINLKTKKTELIMIQGAYRDAGPFKEYVFPRECLKEVLEMLGYQHKDYAIDKKRFWALRRFIGKGVKAIPKKIKEYKDIPKMALVSEKDDGQINWTPYRFIEKKGVHCHIIGIKYDKIGKLANEWFCERL